jgi:hypothetical protein
MRQETTNEILEEWRKKLYSSKNVMRIDFDDISIDDPERKTRLEARKKKIEEIETNELHCTLRQN